MNRKLTVVNQNWPLKKTFTISRGKKDSVDLIFLEIPKKLKKFRLRRAKTRYTVHGRGAKRVTLTGDKSVWISPRHRSGAIQMNYCRSTYHDARSPKRQDSGQKRTSKSVKKVGQKRGPRTSISYSLKLVNDPLFSELRKIIMSKHQCPTACVHPSYPLRINH